MGDTSDEEDWGSEVSSEDEEACTLALNKDLVPKLINRKNNKCEAKWISEGSFAGMAEVLKFKGKHVKSMGINRDSHVLLHVEEIGYMLQREALTVVNGDSFMNIMEIYSRIMTGTYGCTWEAFKVYLELKNLGYIIGRHNVLWSNSSLKARIPEKSLQQLHNELPSHFDKLEVTGELCAQQTNSCADTSANISLDIKMSSCELHVPQYTVTYECDDLLKSLDASTRALWLMFDVFPPNCNFKKTNPGTPDFSLCISSHAVPDSDSLEALTTQNEGIPVKVAIVDAGRVTFFQFDEVQLALLP